MSWHINLGLVRPPFITLGEPDRNRRFQRFHYCCSYMRVLGTRVNSTATASYRSFAQQWTIPAFRLPDTLIAIETCLAERYLTMDYSGFQASCHKANICRCKNLKCYILSVKFSINLMPRVVTFLQFLVCCCVRSADMLKLINLTLNAFILNRSWQNHY
jgi:hypothetical protein